MKKLLKWIAFGFLGLLVLGFVIESTKSPEQKAADQANAQQREADEAQARALQAKQEADSLPTVTATEMVKAYEANTIAADQQFKGKKFKVTGTIGDINTDIMGNPYLVLRASGNPFNQPQFSFDKGASAQLANVTKGSKITLICTGKGDVAKTPMSGSCSII
ncbi:OB-fold protein [Comamonas antarctica]|uniref:tRNA_anti-like n=1 Tax=Comamonas antarctica TaxID=2743470 RepID=A0A6N1X3L5_9BURK|nr:hypothetical protein [Comamonas antarctica]QKV52375.1 hypothetical protein HUK68_05330 [Comamonas antarctica]